MPAGKTYVKIASQTLGSSSATVTFSNLPQNYTDLVLVVSGTHTGSGVAGLYISSINNDSGTNYSRTLLQGDGSTASSTRGSNENSMNIGLIGSTQTNSIFQFMNYSNTTTYKTILARGNDSSALVRASIALWRNTSAITSFSLTGVTFSSGSTFTIYGIECAKSPYAEGGDKVYSTGTHWVHEFYYSGTFVPRQNLTADYLVVAGGGGGAGSYGGGGGAGGLRSTVTATGGGGSLESALSLTASTSYTVTIGAGGAAGPTTSPYEGTNGSNSIFSTVTSTGGGLGGGGTSAGGDRNGATGGSGGGGGAGESSGTSSGGAGTANQGYAGTAGLKNLNYRVGGSGGGAGGVGGTSNSSTGATTGGAGVSVSITGSSLGYAGGGGGASQGGAGANTASSGGGAGCKLGSNIGNGTNVGMFGTANTGGGGGGGPSAGGAGGSGIVIVRYPV